MALSETSFNNKKELVDIGVRGFLAIFMALFVGILAILVIFHIVPEPNRQLATNIILLLLGNLGVIFGYYFSGNPNKKDEPKVSGDNNIVDVTPKQE